MSLADKMRQRLEQTDKVGQGVKQAYTAQMQQTLSSAFVKVAHVGRSSIQLYKSHGQLNGQQVANERIAPEARWWAEVLICCSSERLRNAWPSAFTCARTCAQ